MDGEEVKLSGFTLVNDDEQHWDPYSCGCEMCQEWVRDTLADRAYDDMKERT